MEVDMSWRERRSKKLKKAGMVLVQEHTIRNTTLFSVNR